MSDFEHAVDLPQSARSVDPPWTYEDLAIFALLIVPSFAAGWLIVYLLSFVLPLGKAISTANLLAMQFAGYAVWFVCLALLLKMRYQLSFWQSLGWVSPRSGLAAAAAAGPLLALTLAVLAFALDTPHATSPIEKLISGRRSLIVVGIVVSTLGPLCEELAFRGFMMPLLVRSFGGFAGVVATALPFALIHGPQSDYQWQNILILTLAACAFGWSRLQSGSLIPPVVMHGLYNLTLFAGYAWQKDSLAQW